MEGESEGLEDWLGAVAVAEGVDVGDSLGGGEGNGEVTLNVGCASGFWAVRKGIKLTAPRLKSFLKS